MRRIATGSLVFWTLLVSVSLAQQPANPVVPNLVRYSGVLKDARGAALSSTTVGVTFAIYKQQDGDAPIWMETQNVSTDAAGNYSVLLGSTTATGLPGDLFAQQEQRWLRGWRYISTATAGWGRYCRRSASKSRWRTWATAPPA